VTLTITGSANQDVLRLRDALSQSFEPSQATVQALRDESPVLDRLPERI